MTSGQSKQQYKTWYTKFSKVQFSNPELSKKYLDSIVRIPKLADSLTSKTYNDIGIYNAVIGDYNEAIHYFTKSFYFDKTKSNQTKANILCNIANTQKMQSDFDRELINLNKAKKIYTALKDQKNIFKVDSELSAVYYYKSDYNKALDISSILIQKLADFGDLKLLNIQLIRHANILYNIGDYRNAIVNFKKTLPYFSKNIENNAQNKYVALMSIGNCYTDLKSELAIDYYNQAREGFKSISDIRNENICISKIGTYYFEKKQFSNALPLLKISFEYLYQNQPHIALATYTFYSNTLLQIKDIATIKKLVPLDSNIMLQGATLQEKVFYYETMADVHEKLGNKTLEYNYLKQLKNLYIDREHENTFEEIQKKINLFDVKEQINKNKNLELKLKNTKLQNAIIIVSLLLLVLLLFYLVDKYQKEKKIKKLLLSQLENEKEISKKKMAYTDLQLKTESDIKELKDRELTALQLKIFQIKSKVIGFIEANELKLEDKHKERFIIKLDSFFENEDYWKEFKLKFTNVHPEFISQIRLNHPVLTKKDIDFLMLIKLNLSNKEIATLMNISYESAISKRYLVRKKMNITSDNELLNYLVKI